MEGAEGKLHVADIIIKSGRQIVRPLRNKFDSVQRERERVNTCECVLCSYCILVLAERIVANGKGRRRRRRRRRKEHKAD